MSNKMIVRSVENKSFGFVTELKQIVKSISIKWSTPYSSQNQPKVYIVSNLTIIHSSLIKIRGLNNLLHPFRSNK